MWIFLPDAMIGREKAAHGAQKLDWSLMVYVETCGLQNGSAWRGFSPTSPMQGVGDRFIRLGSRCVLNTRNEHPYC
jgi:hypothetical protein